MADLSLDGLSLVDSVTGHEVDEDGGRCPCGDVCQSVDQHWSELMKCYCKKDDGDHHGQVGQQERGRDKAVG